MAEDLGIKRCWFHKDHYDIPKRKISFVTNIAINVTSRDVLKIIKDGLQSQMGKTQESRRG